MRIGSPHWGQAVERVDWKTWPQKQAMVMRDSWGRVPLWMSVVVALGDVSKPRGIPFSSCDIAHTLRIDARDTARNGWRTTARIKVRR
jgi:hypothetical protein